MIYNLQIYKIFSYFIFIFPSGSDLVQDKSAPEGGIGGSTEESADVKLEDAGRGCVSGKDKKL